MAGPAYFARVDFNLDERRLIELTDSEAAPNVVDEPLLVRVREDASREFDGYVMGNYSTPIAEPVPDLVRLYTAAIGRYRLYQRRETIDCPKSIQDEFKRIVGLLTATGLVLPCARASSPSSPSASEGSLEEGVERVFGRGRDTLG